jgi:hypothetical protein
MDEECGGSVLIKDPFGDGLSPQVNIPLPRSFRYGIVDIDVFLSVGFCYSHKYDHISPIQAITKIYANGY